MVVPNYPPQLASILANLFAEIDADSILLIDKEGVVCGAQGNYQSDETKSLRAIMRGDMFALLAQATASPIKRPGMMFHQGATHDVFLVEIARQHVLGLVLHKGTHFGLVKQCTRQATDAINQALGSA